MKEYQWWANLPDSAHYVRLEDIPKGIAGLQHPDDDLGRVIAEEGIRKQLRRWVTLGCVTVRNPGEGYMPVHGNMFFTGGVLNRIDLERFSNECGVGLRIVPANTEPVLSSGDAPVPAVHTPSTEHWKMRVQAEAAAEWKRLRSMSCNPTRASIRPHLLKWCKDNCVLTSTGINPSDGYLRTHVLSERHWTPPG